MFIWVKLTILIKLKTKILLQLTQNKES